MGFLEDHFLIYIYVSFALCLNLTWCNTEVMPKCPSACTCSEGVRVLRCGNDFKSIKVHDLSSVTKELYLNRDFIGPVLDQTFNNLVALEILDISYSKINFIQNGAFKGLIHLKKLYLQGNLLQMLDESTFQDTRQLEVLDLSLNDFAFIPDAPLRYLPTLKLLNVSFNKVEYARLGVRFQVTTQLKVIDFSGNPIQTVTAEDFETVKRWEPRTAKVFNFSNCNLKMIEADAISVLQNVEYLGLANNINLEIDNVTTYLDALKTVNLKVLDLSFTNLSSKINIADFTAETLGPLSIKELYLAGNGFTDIDEHILTYLNIHKLDLSHNSLKTIGDGIANLANLKYLDASHNAISTVNSTWQNHMTNMEVLNLSHNALNDGSNLNLAKALKLQHLDVSYNMLETFTIPRELECLKTIDLSGNKIQSLNNGEPLIGLNNLLELDISENQLTLINAFMFRDSANIEVAKFSGNQISSISHQAFTPISPKHIDMSKNSIEKLHYFGWTYSQSIDLSQNIINSVEPQTFFFLDSLKKLDLSKNAISNLDVAVFSRLTNLTSLDLSDNFISEHVPFPQLLEPLHSLEFIDISSNNFSKFDYLPGPFSSNFELKEIRMSKNQISVLSPWIFSSLQHLKYVDFSRNPFHCGCDVVPLQNWALTTAVQIKGQDRYGYACSSPNTRSAKTLLTFKVRTFECQRYLFHIVIFSSAGGAAMLLAVSIATVCYLVKRYRNRKVIIVDDAEANLIGYKKLNKKDKQNGVAGKGVNNDLMTFRENYLYNSPSDTLIDVEFEAPNLVKNHNHALKLDREKKEKKKAEESKISKKSKSKTEKSKHKKHDKRSDKSKRATKKHPSLDDLLSKGIKYDKGNSDRNKENLKKFLEAMDKEYRNRLARKRRDKRHNNGHELFERKRRPMGNKELVRLISMRESRSTPDVISYVNSLPRYRNRDYNDNRYGTVPIYHIDHMDRSHHGWARSMVDLPRVHRSSTAAMNRHLRYDREAEERLIRKSQGRQPNGLYKENQGRLLLEYLKAKGRLPDGYHTIASTRGRPVDAQLPEGYHTIASTRGRTLEDTRLPEGYHTIASTRGRTLVDSRLPERKSHNLDRVKSNSTVEHLSQWL